jgi:hypothetical protein
LAYLRTQQFEQLSQSSKDEKKVYKIKLSEIQKKIGTIEEKYFALSEMNRETFEKLNSKYLDDKTEIIRCLQSLS